MITLRDEILKTEDIQKCFHVQIDMLMINI